MENEIYKYILYVLDKRENQDEFINELAKEMCYMLDMKDVKFYYSEENAIFTFQTKQDFPLLSELLGIIMEMNKVPYILLPYSNDKMSFFLSKDVSDHLFSDKLSEDTKMDEYLDKLNKMGDNMKNLDDILFKNIFSDDEDDEDDDVLKKIYRENDKKVGQNKIDQIFDKINKLGIKSLTTQEKQILDNYSKQL